MRIKIGYTYRKINITNFKKYLKKNKLTKIIFLKKIAKIIDQKINIIYMNKCSFNNNNFRFKTLTKNGQKIP